MFGSDMSDMFEERVVTRAMQANPTFYTPQVESHYSTNALFQGPIWINHSTVQRVASGLCLFYFSWSGAWGYKHIKIYNHIPNIPRLRT